MIGSDRKIRCAVYTRKSSEEGLDQSFNSLHAQREACEAYVLSQKHEGWEVVPIAYDDGGFSGGNMERPGLKKLLADISAGLIDTIVVYKVDRLTRSLADFAKIVESFDKKGVSFVSVTQQFNTTSSMGRLTLNVLLSFAQFEREVTGERIRDKVAASKKKGMWMNAAITYLLEERGFALEELAYRKFRLRSALERKMAAGLVLAKQHVFNNLFADETHFDVCDEHSMELRQGRYAYDTPYTGFVQLKRHFFPIIGNLKSTGEEFECAEYIANRLEDVEWWVRNVEKKQGSLWLQTASDRFYPDFVVRLTSGVTLAVEYKGGHIADSADSREKMQVGEMWARRSNGRCRFVWIEKKNWSLLKDSAK